MHKRSAVATLILLIVTLGLSGCAQKKNMTESMAKLEIKSAWVRAMPPNAKNSAAYLMVHNPTDQADRLIAAQSPIAKMVEIHTVEKQGEAMIMMTVDGVPVPAKSMATLKPGGYHIMLMGLNQAPKTGDQVPLTLTFEKAGDVQVTAAVQESGKEVMKNDHMKHGKVKHGDMTKEVEHGKMKKEKKHEGIKKKK